MKWIPTAAATAVVLFLAGCGGGGGGGVVPATDTTTPVGVTVIDGAIRNALVCLDKNLNSACDADEPSARTDVSGNATLQVDEADAGKYPVVAVVGTDAVDADHGPVTTAFTLKAPADKPAVVSPLTTLVQTKIEATGSSTADAESIVQSQLGMNVSLFTDFTKDTSTEGATLGAMARLIVVTTQEQSKTLEASVGTEAIDGSTISAADLDEIIRRKLLEIVPRLVATLADPAVQTAIATGDPTAINAALTPKVADVVASTNLTAATIGTVVGIANQSGTPEASQAPVASLTLASLDFTDAANWFRRVFTGSAAQVTPDASGNIRFIDRKQRSSSGVVANWTAGGQPSGQSDTHWNGSAWTDCPIGYESTQPPRDASGRTAYNYCNGREHGFSTRATFDVSGKRMIDIYNQARDAGYLNLTIRGVPADKLGSATFPTGSKLFYQTSTATTATTAYVPTLNNVVRVVKSGLDACSGSFVPYGDLTKAANTLEEVAAGIRGTPCVGPTDATTPRNEAYWHSTLHIGGAPSSMVRVAFGDNNAAKYYACPVDSNGSPWNCDLIGTGTYAIATLGNARVLSFANAPVQAAAFAERLFVERDGLVHYGFKSRPAANLSARLNLPAATALFSQLGITAPMDPESSFGPTPATYQGDWYLRNPAEGVNSYTMIRISQTFNGTTGYQCTDFDDIFDPGSGSPYTCNLTSFDPATGAFVFALTDPGDEGSFTGTLSLSTARATGTYTPDVGSAENLVGARR